MTSQKLHPAVKIILIVIAVILALALLAVGCFFLVDRIRHGSFYRQAQRENSIPGLSDGMIPQGMEYFADEDTWIFCGYMNDDSASRFYIAKGTEKTAASVAMKNEDGSDYLGHTGGIARLGDYIYVTGSNECVIFSAKDVFDGDNTATITKRMKLPVDPAYCTIRDGVLYAGSYYYPEKYETPEEQRMVTPAGDQNYAIMLAYTLDAETGLIKEDALPTVFSTPGMCQGAAWIDENTIVLSTSWGLSTSKLLIYDISKAHTGTYTPGDDVELPMYYLDSDSLIHDIIAPCMAEQIIVKDGRIYVVNEAASKKYMFGILLGSQYVYSYPIPEKEAK